MTRRTFLDCLCWRRRTSPVPRSFHSADSAMKRKSLARLRGKGEWRQLVEEGRWRRGEERWRGGGRGGADAHLEEGLLVLLVRLDLDSLVELDDGLKVGRRLLDLGGGGGLLSGHDGGDCCTGDGGGREELESVAAGLQSSLSLWMAHLVGCGCVRGSRGEELPPRDDDNDDTASLRPPAPARSAWAASLSSCTCSRGSAWRPSPSTCCPPRLAPLLVLLESRQQLLARHSSEGRPD